MEENIKHFCAVLIKILIGFCAMIVAVVQNNILIKILPLFFPITKCTFIGF